MEAGYAALYYGADAVYLGLQQFSARAGAENFTFEELDEFTAYAHLLNRKVFVALNTILSEGECGELPRIFAALKRVKVDALIIQDLGVFYLAKRFLPEIELHASTQMAVHNAEGAKFLHRLGFKRVVLARELTKAEIAAIAKAVPEVDLEVFVHGALCYSYSGQCLFSALEYGKSANRGRCVYPCRSLFKNREICPTRSRMETSLRSGHVRLCTLPSLGGHPRRFEQISRFSGAGREDGEVASEGNYGDDYAAGEFGACSHLFSMKDLALEEEVLDLPALSLKIEGRKKSALYVAAVTNYYRHILDNKKKDVNEAFDIKQIFSRPWCRFHYNGKDKNVTDREFVGHRGLVIGKVEKVVKNRLCFRPARKICRYDGLQIDVKGEEKPFGFGIKAMYVQGKPVFEADGGTSVEVELPKERFRLEVGAPVYLASSTEVKGKYGYLKPKPGEYRNLKEFDAVVEINRDKVLAFAGEATAVVLGEFEPAKDAAQAAAAVCGAFAKTGGTGVKFANVEVRNVEGLFVPVSNLNELRRQLVQKCLEGDRGDDALFELPRFTLADAGDGEPVRLKLYEVSSDGDKFEADGGDFSDAWFVLPQVCRNTARLCAAVSKLYEAGARQFVCENYYGFELLRGYKDIKVAAGSFIYVMNSFAAAALKEEFGASFATLALESSAKNMTEVVAKSPLRLCQAIKAHPPLFTSAVCIRGGDCRNCKRGEKRFLLENGGRSYMAVSKDCGVQVFALKAYEREKVEGVWGVVCEE